MDSRASGVADALGVGRCGRRKGDEKDGVWASAAGRMGLPSAERRAAAGGVDLRS